MFKSSSFKETNAQDILLGFANDFTFPKKGKTSEVNDVLENVLIKLGAYAKAPKYILTRALYDEEDGVTLKSARFVVRPSVSDELFVAEAKKTFTLYAGKNFFGEFITEMAKWFDEYEYYAKLQSNLTDLNAEFTRIAEENEINFGISFSLGSGVIDATDDFAVIGIPVEVVTNLSTLPLFDTDYAVRKENYEEKVKELLQECSSPLDILSVKSQVTKELGIYTRKSLNKLLRKFVTRKVDNTRVGVCYYETDEVFALVDKVAVTEAQLAEMDASTIVVQDNTQANSKEKHSGRNKIVAYFRVSPFNKEDGTPAELALADIVK